MLKYAHLLVVMAIASASCGRRPAPPISDLTIHYSVSCGQSVVYACPGLPPACGPNEFPEFNLEDDLERCTGWTGKCYPCFYTCEQRLEPLISPPMGMGSAHAMPSCPEGTYPGIKYDCGDNDDCGGGTYYAKPCKPCDAPCTFGADISCTDFSRLGHILGTCNPDGTCTCRPGTEINPVTQKCMISHLPLACPAFVRALHGVQDPTFCDGDLLWSCGYDCLYDSCATRPQLRQECDYGCTDLHDGAARCN